MHSYRYTASLRLWHPKRNLARAEIVYSVHQSQTWTQGEPRKTPTGTALQGVYPNSYWTARPLGDRGASSRKQPLESFVEQTIDRIRPHRAFISRLYLKSGAQIVYLDERPAIKRPDGATRQNPTARMRTREANSRSFL